MIVPAARPLIGITCSYDTDKEASILSITYSLAVEKVGGLAVVLPLTTDPEALSGLAVRLDGIILSGGPDVDPSLFGEEPAPKLGGISPERDLIDLWLARDALARDLPILGICRGIQSLNVAAGGTLVQDIASQIPGAIKHRQDAPRWHAGHAVSITPGSLLAAVMGCDSLRVNSYHHQSCKRVAAGFAVSATAADGVIEAIEDPRRRFALGIQWHPEAMWDRHPIQERLFAALVRAAAGGTGA
jgi:putative glutamine amidotransferase